MVVIVVVAVVIVIAVVIVVVVMIVVMIPIMVFALVVSPGYDEGRAVIVDRDPGTSLRPARRPNENRHSQEERADYGHR